MGFNDLNAKLTGFRERMNNAEASGANTSKRLNDIVEKLDAKDGKVDGKISASIWNEYSGKNVQQDISVNDAKRAIEARYERLNEQTKLQSELDDMAKEPIKKSEQKFDNTDWGVEHDWGAQDWGV